MGSEEREDLILLGAQKNKLQGGKMGGKWWVYGWGGEKSLQAEVPPKSGVEGRRRQYLPTLVRTMPSLWMDRPKACVGPRQVFALVSIGQQASEGTGQGQHE